MVFLNPDYDAIIIIIIAGNHKNIFNDARVPWSEYRYYDPKTVGLDFEGMLEDIKVIVVLTSLSYKLPKKEYSNWKSFFISNFLILLYERL